MNLNLVWFLRGENMVEVITIGRNSDTKQRTSQAIQADSFDAALTEQWLIDGLGGVPTIAESYSDLGKSGSKNFEKRTDLHRLLEDIQKKHRGKPLLVMNTSRFDRQHPLDTMELFNQLRKAGCWLVSIDDRKIYKGDELTELLDLLLKANENHKWSTTIACGVVKGRVLKTEQGQWTSSVVPYGMARLIIDDDGIEKIYPRNSKFTKPKSWKCFLVPGDNAEQEIVRWLFSEYATKNISRCELASILNKHDNPLIRSGPAGNGWYDNTVRNILMNAHYNGCEFVGKQSSGAFYRVGATHPIKMAESTGSIMRTGLNERGRMVDVYLWATVQAKLNRKKGTKSKTASNGEGFVLTGVLKCGNCGGNMYARKTDSDIQYRCNNAHKNGSKGCGTWKIYESEMLPFLVNQIDAQLLQKLNDKPEVKEHDECRKNQLEQSLNETNKGIETLKSKIKLNPAAADILSDSLCELAEKKKELTEAIANYRIDDSSAILHAVNRWKEIIEPNLVNVRADNVGVGNATVERLGLQNDCDRLFNFAGVRPSVLRETLHSLNATVELWFANAGNGPHDWRIDFGKLTASISGKDCSGNIRTSACRRWRRIA